MKMKKGYFFEMIPKKGGVFMKKLLALFLALILCLGCLLSCDKSEDTSCESSSESLSESSSESKDSSSESSSEGSSSSEKAPDAVSNGKECIIKNSELVATRENEDYYPTVNAGNYLGADLPSEIGNYCREILTYEEFARLVENPSVISEAVFNDSAVLVVKRVTGGYFSDIGFKKYSTQIIGKTSIELDIYTNMMAGTDDVKTRYDYLLIPRNRYYEIDEYEPLSGELTIKENKKWYYEHYERPLGEKIENGLYFESMSSANEYLSSKGYDKMSFSDKYDVLILSLDLGIDFGLDSKSYNLGFCNFNTNGSDIYITLERVIIDENYGSGDKAPSVCAIQIPKSEICTEIGDEITVHILVSDSLIR